MLTAKQIQANQKNAQKSTGPRSLEGKMISSGNALQHGILSRRTLLPIEDKAEYDSFVSGIYAQLDPHGELEQLLVDRIATAAWRLGRIVQVESKLFDVDEFFTIGEANISTPVCLSGNSFSLLSRYEMNLERSFYRALHEFQRVKAMRLGEKVLAPVSVDVDLSIPSETDG